MRRAAIRNISHLAISGLKKPIIMPNEGVDRTLFLLRNRLEPFNDIADYADIDKSWIESMARDGRKIIRSSADAEHAEILHNWLLVRELTCPCQRIGPLDFVRIVGRAALFMDRARLGKSASFLAMDQRRIHETASRRLDDLDRHGQWLPQSDDQKSLPEIRSYILPVRRDDRIFGGRRRPPYFGRLDDFILPAQTCLLD